MQRRLIVLDSNQRINQDDNDGSIYQFRLNNKIMLDGILRLEQFIFQNSQYVFSLEKKSNKFIYSDDNNTVTVTFEGKFDNTDSFVKRFNEVMVSYGLNIRITYISYLYEFKIQHLDGTVFKIEEYYEKGKFKNLLGLGDTEGSNVYTNTNVPKLFSQNLIYITLPDVGYYTTIAKDSKPYTFIVLSQPGFEVVANYNNTFANEFNVSNRELDEITIRILDDDGFTFVNNKGNANFKIIMSY